MTKPFARTSTNHAFAYAFYGGEAVLGALILFWDATVDSLATVLFVPFAGAAMFAAGIVGVIAITAAHRQAVPDQMIALEGYVTIVMLIVNLSFFGALLGFYPVDKAISTKVFTTIFWAGAGLRWLQIKYDEYRYHQALRTPKPSDASLAEHDTTDD